MWCDCVSFVQHRLVCKHMWCVLENDFTKLPESYKRCAEYNASTQLTDDVRPSVLRLTQEQQCVPLSAPCSAGLHNDAESEDVAPVDTTTMDAEMAGNEADSVDVAEVSGAETTDVGDASAFSDMPLRTDVCIFIKHCQSQSRLMFISVNSKEIRESVKNQLKCFIGQIVSKAFTEN